MKRKIVKILSVVIAMTILSSGIALANDKIVKTSSSSDGNLNSTVEPRSLYLASGISEITNKGEGVLGIYADFTSYKSVDWACLTIKLERRKGTSGSWSSVETYTKEFFVSDRPDGMLIAGETAFDVYGLATDYYYRLRCEHKVKTPSGSYETKNTQTNGVLLTSYPVYRSADMAN